MSKEERRDDIFFHRLSSFVYKSGGLMIKRIKKIKPKIFKIESISNGKYVLKGHDHHNRVKQQWEFFKKMDGKCFVPYVPFPNGNEVIKEGKTTWTISPFMNGCGLTFQKETDRKNALHVLQTFHSDARDVHIHKLMSTATNLLIDRMKKRFSRFIQSKTIFRKFGYEALFKEICVVTSKVFEIVSFYPWHEQMTIAKKDGVWIHGDVASHNFIRSEKTVLIDFDLLNMAPQLYDYIQLGQRFMPYLNWNLKSLLTYKMVPQRDVAIWLLMIGIPSDLMREWHHATAKNDLHIKTYLQKTREEWELRKIFLRNVQIMLQS